jgi:hypothetical protein
MALYRPFLSPDRQDYAYSWFSLPEKWPFQAESGPAGLLTGVYICEEIMTLPMVRRRKKTSIHLVSAGVRAGRPSMSLRTLKEVLWLKGA